MLMLFPNIHDIKGALQLSSDISPKSYTKQQ